MRVLLIVPTNQYRNTKRFPNYMSNTDLPAGYAYLASALKGAGHEVIGLNLNNDDRYRSAQEMLRGRITECIRDQKPELIGLGGLCTDYAFLKDAIAVVRREDEAIPIVCGGGIITNDTEFAFQTLRPDFCIVGEGEEIVVRLAAALESGDHRYEEIPNLGYWKDGGCRFTAQDFDYGDINRRPFPDYEPFGIDAMIDNHSLAARYLYRYPRVDARPMTLVGARSCPFKCSFCVHSRGPKYRARSIENILEEIDFLHRRYRFNVLIILDELFAATKKRLVEFSIALIEAREAHGWDFHWTFQTHASSRLDQESMELAKQAGCYCFGYGMESASPRVLVSMNKKTKPAQFAEGIRLANEAGVGFGGNFIFGDSVENGETIAETMDFFYRHCLDAHVYLGTVRPYPGSLLFERCREQGIVGDKGAFYETIDETPYNLTVMPDELWYPWAKKVGRLGNRLAWAKAATTTRSTRESEEPSGTGGSAESVWKIWALCPHCGKEGCFRELLSVKDVAGGEDGRKGAAIPEQPSADAGAKASAAAPTGDRLKTSLLRLVPGKRLKRAAARALFASHPLYQLVNPIAGKVRGKNATFVTGCPHCNKRIRVHF